jgi:hypothetical protein
MAHGFEDMLQVWRELLERTRRTRPRTAQRKLTILRAEADTMDMKDVLETNEISSWPAIAIWADAATWSRTIDNGAWNDGNTWS